MGEYKTTNSLVIDHPLIKEHSGKLSSGSSPTWNLKLQHANRDSARRIPRRKRCCTVEEHQPAHLYYPRERNALRPSPPDEPLGHGSSLTWRRYTLYLLDGYTHPSPSLAPIHALPCISKHHGSLATPGGKPVLREPGIPACYKKRRPGLGPKGPRRDIPRREGGYCRLGRQCTLHARVGRPSGGYNPPRQRWRYQTRHCGRGVQEERRAARHRGLRGRPGSVPGQRKENPSDSEGDALAFARGQLPDWVSLWVCPAVGCTAG